MSPKKLFIALGIAAGAFASGTAHSAAVIGGSALLTAGYADQLETWLGEGPITLTNIFTKQAGDTSFDFHTAVDGKGRTFSIIYATETDTGNSAVIGGYDPLSWSSNGDYQVNPTLDGRTAFLFNLSLGKLFRQLTTSPTGGVYSGADAGYYQTYNFEGYGPIFGGGNDLFVNHQLDSGYSYLYSYSSLDGVNAQNSIVDNSLFQGYDLRVAEIEVFTISDGPVVDGHVPEPGTLALVCLALTAGVANRRRPHS